MITDYKILDNNFIRKIEEFTNGELFQLFYLFTGVNMVNYGSLKLKNAFILDDGKSEIIGVLTESSFYLYGKNWNKSTLEKITKKINFKSFPEGFFFLGNERFISDLFDFAKIKLEVFKNRSFYKLSKQENSGFENKNEIDSPSINETIEITHLYQQYYVEEYNGQNNKEFNETKEKVMELIKEENIVVSRNQDEITGFCTFMHKETDSPMIGTVFVSSEFRNNGIGKSLIDFVSKDLLKSSDFVYLMTTKENIESNKMVESVGYKKVYDHTSRIITVGNTVYN
ncbi:GNAT family N-acetyltransferase [uncultured Tenacibaculum sp.]|uniref:GNAT family N-acetyltransferase n=1 Tax=uncultured Tenacibaculum sp. TaxID=174713 RepID=UPI002610F9DB|nr:GNAT family N-acetyltransferase [uncultured Tenacibaculum sp.]